MGDRCCYGCLCSEGNLSQFAIGCEPLKSIFQVELIPLCYLCKRIAQHTELFILNVQSNQILLENFHDNLSPIQKVRTDIHQSLTLTRVTLDSIQLTGTNYDEESCTVISSSFKELVKLEPKDEEYLEGVCMEEEMYGLTHSYVKEEDEFTLETLKMEIDDLNTKKNDILSEKNKPPGPNSRISKGKIHHVRISIKQCMEERLNMAQDKKYKDSLYKCTDCVKGFAQSDSFDRHMEKHSMSRGEFECTICKLRFETYATHVEHIKIHLVRYKCSECSLMCTSRTTAHAHYATIHCTELLKASVKCDWCPKIYPYKSQALRKHKRYCRERERPVCGHCHKTYKSKESLRVHITSVHREIVSGSEIVKRYVCEECGKSFISPSSLRNHSVRHTDVKDYFCVECDKSFKTELRLKSHLKTALHLKYSDFPLVGDCQGQRCVEGFGGDLCPAEGQSRYSCEHCHKRFTTKRTRNNHMNSTHLNLRPFACDKCDKSYMSRWSLSQHIQFSHEGAKRPLRYPCSLCERVFDRNSILKAHLRTHTGERPYQCSRCPMQFGQSSARGTHFKLVHLRLTRDGRPKHNTSK